MRVEARSAAWSVGWLLVAALLALLYRYVDVPLSQALRGLEPETVALIGRFTDLGKSEWSLVPSGVLALACLWLRGRAAAPALRRAYGWLAGAGSFVFLSVALSGILVNLIKVSLGRARPKLLDRADFYGFEPFTFDADFHAFPSGHANSAIAAALALALLLPRWRAAFLAAGAAIALTRVAINAHYLSDVVGGAALAVATTLPLRRAFARRALVFEAGPDGRLRVQARGRRLAAALLARAGPTIRRARPGLGR